MTKPKKVEEEKPDNLEIISIGVLYQGPWDKKYWSCSRGKDRYPYAVGYQSIRAHNGSTFKMEIREGLKGPLFLITSADGQSCSGQTADIACNKFQKQDLPRVKLLHGKRSSCKIDGVEFFGFRNSFVQRLLRELVANVDGAAKQSSSSSSLGKEDSGLENDRKNADPCISPDLHHDPAKRVTGKRSRKPKVINEKPIVGVKLKKSRSQNATCNGEELRERRGNQRDINTDLTRESKAMVDNELCIHPAASLASENLETIDVKDTENSLDRPGECDIPKFSLSMEKSESNEEAQFLKDAPKTNSEDLYAPDTLDDQYVDISDPVSTSFKEKSCHTEDELLLSQVVNFEAAPESHLGDKMVTLSFNSSSEKGDFDSVGENIAKSMMTVLLPQALPLLKYTKRKKKADNTPPQAGLPMDVLPPHTLHIESYGTNKLVHFVEAEQASVKKACSPEDMCLLDRDDKQNVTSACHASKEIYHSPHKPQEEISHMGDIIISKCDLSYTSPQKKAFCGISKDITSSLQTHFEEKTFNASKMDMDTSIPLSQKELAFKIKDFESDCMVSTEMQDAALLTRNYSCPLSEIIICRNFEDGCAIEGYTAPETLQDTEYCQLSPFNEGLNEDILIDVEASLKSKRESLHTEKNMLKTEANLIPTKSHTQADSDLKLHIIEEINGELGKYVELLGCYVHPMPISLVLSSITENEIFLCVLCGLRKDRALFMYKIPIKEPKVGCPSFIGHASITMPLPRNAFGRQMSLDGSNLQFTPDGQSLVLLHSIKTPYCGQGNVNCPCSACTSDCLEENAIKIVKVKLGYVSLISKMRTDNSVLCIVVCGPDHLVALEEGGRLHLWAMNSTWSAQTEEFVIPSSNCISPCVEDLKQIPNHAHLVIGHNSYGDFGLWDISKRILISRFSAPNKSAFQFLPISLFGWKRKDPISINPSLKENMETIMAATKVSLSGQNEKNTHLLSQENEIGIWLLVSTVPHSDYNAQYNYTTDCKINPGRCWRLALLVDNVVILGSVLDQSVSAIGVSGGHGIIATSDGLVYMWDLSTGTKLGTLHNFKDCGISCIAATDGSRSGVIAVADDGGQLRVYVHHQSDS